MSSQLLLDFSANFAGLSTSGIDSMENAKQLTLANISEAYMKTADVLLVLDDGVAILCHSQILSKHSAVFCNMFSDLAQHEGKVKIPLPGFSEAQCSALLTYLYSNGLTSSGVAFATQGRAHLDAAGVVARFAHTYDAPHVLRHVEAYLTAFMDQFKRKPPYAEAGQPGVCDSKDFWSGQSWLTNLTCMNCAATANGPW